MIPKDIIENSTSVDKSRFIIAYRFTKLIGLQSWSHTTAHLQKGQCYET